MQLFNVQLSPVSSRRPFVAILKNKKLAKFYIFIAVLKG